MIIKNLFAVADDEITSPIEMLNVVYGLEEFNKAYNRRKRQKTINRGSILKPKKSKNKISA